MQYKKFCHLICRFSLGFLIFLTSMSWALGEKPWLAKSGNGNLTLVNQQIVTDILLDDSEPAGVKRATNNLQTDIEKVSGKKPTLKNDIGQIKKTAIIIGTIGQSQTIDKLISSNKINVEKIQGQWDAFQVDVVNNPFPNIKKALVIVGANKRGTTYGIYSLSEQIGVSPWYWWADVPIKKKDTIYIDNKTFVSEIPKVKYRGIFLNDEAPALTNWAKEKYGNFNHKFYENVFELLLRLKANFLWPAMWNNAFADDDIQNMILADEYGIVMSTSHHEPMMRADKEWNRHGKGPWEYSKNPENLYNFWMDGAKRNKNYESIYTMGMRGQNDTPMSEGQNIGLLEKIVHDQREILGKVFGPDKITDVPQVWALYKEVQGFYERGMRVPDDVILLWCDDNWGNIRRLPAPEERKRIGGAGVYYHFDYVGGPRSYRWINTISIAKIWEQMHLAYEMQANKIWVVNVGDLKPMEYPIEFFMNMAWNPDAWPKERIPEFSTLWATREFGSANAKDIAEIMTGYTRHNLNRKPELQAANIYSQIHYDESNRVTQHIKKLAEKAEALYGKMPADQRDAFYQLVLFPTKASANITEMYDAQAKNHLYAKQMRSTANIYAEKVRELFAKDATLEAEYHALNGGKWNHFMDQPHIGYVYWHNPAADVMPVVHIFEPSAPGELGVAVEGMEVSFPIPAQYALPRFDPLGKQVRVLEVFNKGKEILTATAKTDSPWITLSETSIQVKDVSPIRVSIDWSKAPKGLSTGKIQIVGSATWWGATILVNVFNPEYKKSDLKGFVEADGYISIEAEHYQRKQASGQLNWEKIPEHGRSLSSMSVYPIGDWHFTDVKGAPYLEYDIFVFTTNAMEIEGFFAPSWPFLPNNGLRYAIALDDEVPQIVNLTQDMSDPIWEETVSTGVRRGKTTHHVNKVGRHKLRIYSLDSGVTLQKVVINTGGLQPSYLGPLESKRF